MVPAPENHGWWPVRVLIAPDPRSDLAPDLADPILGSGSGSEPTRGSSLKLGPDRAQIGRLIRIGVACRGPDRAADPARIGPNRMMMPRS